MEKYGDALQDVIRFFLMQQVLGARAGEHPNGRYASSFAGADVYDGIANVRDLVRGKLEMIEAFENRLGVGFAALNVFTADNALK